MKAAFDVLANSYDADFTTRQPGRWLRSLVWRQLEHLVRPGDRLLDLACGTGEDAVWLAGRGARVTAVDCSSAMLALTERKAASSGSSEFVRTKWLDLADLQEESLPGEPFDGVLSDFGGLNCLAERRSLADWLAGRVAREGWLALILMNPFCLWEISWFGLKGLPAQARRRWNIPAQVQIAPGRLIDVWYPRVVTIREEFSTAFRFIRTVGIGVFLPPAYLSQWVEAHPKISGVLYLLDRMGGKIFPWKLLGDHYLVIFERR